MTILLLVFGAGWENLVFAVQIVYNFSLLAFLGQMLLVDHDGPLDRRDGFGVLVSLIGVSSSGFGPFFGFGVGLLLVLRRRWLAAVVAVVPQALAWIWWWSTWGADPAGGDGTASVRFVAHWVEHGLWAVFGSLSGDGAAGLAGDRALRRDGSVVRHGRIPAGADHRHAGDRPRDVHRHRHQARDLRRVRLGVAAVPVHGGDDRGADAGVRARSDQAVRELGEVDPAGGAAARDRSQHRVDARRRRAAGAPRRAPTAGCSRSSPGSEQRFDARPDRSMSTFSPDVLVIDLDTLVDDGAITRVPPTTPEEKAAVAARPGTHRAAVTPAIASCRLRRVRSTNRSQSSSPIAADIAMYPRVAR